MEKQSLTVYDSGDPHWGCIIVPAEASTHGE